MKTGKTPVRVIYIVGNGRSGSTILDIVLGNHSQVESVGELSNLPRSGWINNEYCACGQRGQACPFWTRVRQEWVSRIGVDDVQGYISLQDAFRRIRHLPRLLSERYNPSPLFQIYTERTHALFEAIHVVSGKPFIVDSSKSSGRALALAMMPGIDLRLIHLVRDGRGVVWSRKKAFCKDEKKGVQRALPSIPIWQASLDWCLSNSTAELVLRWAKTDGIRIHYEDFVKQPQESLKRIEQVSGIDFTSIASGLRQGKEMIVGHTIAGNRIRMSGTIHLKPDYEWKTALSMRDRRIFWLWAGIFAKRYGYSWE